MAFPTSPTNGQITVLNGITYTYASATSSWTRATATMPTLSVYTDSFIGDGSTTNFTLSLTPSSKDFVSINIDGVSQLKSAYSLLNNIVTFTGTPESGAVIEVKSWSSASVSVLTGLTYDSFTGDGSTTAYTLGTSPTNKNYTMVSIGGLTQNKNNYGVSGSTLTFTTAPPNTAPIEVVTFGPATPASLTVAGSTSQIQYNNSGLLGASSGLTFNNISNTLTASNLSVTGNTTTSNLSVTSTATLATISSSTGTTTFTGNVTISGTTNLGADANLRISGGSLGQTLVSNGAGGVTFSYTAARAAGLVMGIIFGG
jgi:hypothetical protein